MGLVLMNTNRVWFHKIHNDIKVSYYEDYKLATSHPEIVSETVINFLGVEGCVVNCVYKKLTELRGDISSIFATDISLLDFGITKLDFLEDIRKNFTLLSLCVYHDFCDLNRILISVYYKNKKTMRLSSRRIGLLKTDNNTAESVIEKILSLFE